MKLQRIMLEILLITFLAANNAFERFTELKVEDIIGKRVTEVLPGINESDFIEKYGNVAN